MEGSNKFRVLLDSKPLDIFEQYCSPWISTTIDCSDGVDETKVINFYKREGGFRCPKHGKELVGTILRVQHLEDREEFDILVQRLNSNGMFIFTSYGVPSVLAPGANF